MSVSVCFPCIYLCVYCVCLCFNAFLCVFCVFMSVSMFLLVYVFVCLCISMCMCMCMCVYACLFICVCMFLYVCMCLSLCVCLCVCVCLYVSMCVCLLYPIIFQFWYICSRIIYQYLSLLDFFIYLVYLKTSKTWVILFLPTIDDSLDILRVLLNMFSIWILLLIESLIVHILIL